MLSKLPKKVTALARAGGWLRSFRSANPPHAPRRFGSLAVRAASRRAWRRRLSARSARCSVQRHRPPRHAGWA